MTVLCLCGEKTHAVMVGSLQLPAGLARLPVPAANLLGRTALVTVSMDLKTLLSSERIVFRLAGSVV